MRVVWQGGGAGGGKQDQGYTVWPRREFLLRDLCRPLASNNKKRGNAQQLTWKAFMDKRTEADMYQQPVVDVNFENFAAETRAFETTYRPIWFDVVHSGRC